MQDNQKTTSNMKERIKELRQAITFMLEHQPSNPNIQKLKSELQELLVKSAK